MTSVSASGAPAWPTPAARRLNLSVPVIQAPMAGGPSTVELAAAVSEAGGLGSIGGAYLTPERLRDEIRGVRLFTARPFAVNLFVPSTPDVTDDEIERALELLEPYRTELGLPARPVVRAWAEELDAQLEVVVDERVAVFSFAFGVMPVDRLDAVKATGAVTVGTATNVAEARVLAGSGVDIVCAQGAEAGGHHGSWLADAEDSLIGTLALVPMVCDAVTIPVVAAGGIMDGRGVAAVLCLGAGAAHMGTAFMLRDEAGTAPPHRDALSRASETDVATTSKVTGRLARGVRNRLMDDLREARVPSYPVMNALTAELRRTAAAQGNAELMSMWCGQAAPLAAPGSAAALVHAVAEALAGHDRQ